jgi:branched-chain amino acid aminotransferase
MVATVWINGERQAVGGVHLSARDRGLTLADGVFETMRASAGTVFRLDRHLARIERALKVLEIPVQTELADWVGAALIDAAGEDAAVRLTVTRGAGAHGVAPPDDAHPTVIVAVNPMPVFPPSVYEVGLSAHICSGRRNEHSMTAGLKTIAYTDSIAAMLEARRAGCDEGLLLDTAGHCSEATASNLFIVRNGALVTPAVSCAALPGITRASVFEIAMTLGLPAAERECWLPELLEADEAFLTSSLRGIAPLVRVGGQAVGAGRPGALTRRIAHEYAALVKLECR